jgi:flagellar biosynthesis/type III secretory pathway protein FliH
MHDAFVPLHVALRPQVARELQAETPASRPDANEGSLHDETCADISEGDEAPAAARRFNAALCDALAFSLERLVRDIACEVLARELELAPCDVATIAARALDRYAGEGVVRVRVHPGDVPVCATLDVPVVADRSLRPGDVVFDVRCGSIDASLGARLEAVLL